MRYRSTGGAVAGRTFDQVVIEGAAPDGGLYLPEEIPDYEAPDPRSPHRDYVSRSLEAFGAEDVDDLVDNALSSFHHPEIAPLRRVGDRTLLELFWGPTLSFKDHALQVLGPLVDRYLSEMDESRTVLVATSGDTGSAAIAGFAGLDSVDIVVLYPRGLVSDYQRRQMTTVAESNVTVIAVDGTFDDCQRMVKEAFRSRNGLASANSINWGRVAAQVGYYMSAGARIGQPFAVVVPTGNFGNAYSAWTAKQMGAPIASITVATNTNRVLYDLHETGEVSESPVTPTLAPAMDIQVPSNLDRFLFGHSRDSFAAEFGAGWADDTTISETIYRVYQTEGEIIDPHTAVAWSVADDVVDGALPVVVVATAHPAKFANTIRNAIGVTPPVPEWGEIPNEAGEREIEIPADTGVLLDLLP